MASKVVALPIVGMVLSECAQVGLMIVSKAAMSDGMSNLLFIFYSNALASLLLLPISFLFHRTQRPALTFSVLCGFFLLGLLGCLIQVFGYAGIYYSSPTLGTAMLNLVPAFTFILAVTLRMEKLDWRSSTGLAKTVGTIVSLVGAFVVTFYDGPSLLSTSSLSNVSYKKLLFQQSNWVIGGFLLLVDAVMTSVWVIIQASILKKYPAELILVFFYCFFVSILSAVVCLFVERDLSAWSLKSRTRLFSVLYSGVFGSAFQVGVSTWCLYRTGPVFVSMFKPLGIVISVAVGVIFSGETLFLGRLLGAIIIIVGFYSVLWGKATEAKIDKDLVSSLESSTDQEPLLQNSNEEHNSFVQKIKDPAANIRRTHSSLLHSLSRRFSLSSPALTLLSAASQSTGPPLLTLLSAASQSTGPPLFTLLSAASQSTGPLLLTLLSAASQSTGLPLFTLLSAASQSTGPPLLTQPLLSPPDLSENETGSMLH